MQISVVQYLEMMDRIKVLQKRNDEQAIDNRNLTDQIIKQRNIIQMMEKEAHQKQQQFQQRQKNMWKLAQQKSDEIVMSMKAGWEEEKLYFYHELQKVRGETNYEKMKEMEKKMTQNRFKNHQLVEFHYQIKSLYHSWTKKKNSPTISQLLKWVNDRKVQATEKPPTFKAMTQNTFNTEIGKNKRPPSKPKRNGVKKQKKITLEKQNGVQEEFSYQDILASSSSRKEILVERQEQKEKEEIQLRLTDSQVLCQQKSAERESEVEVKIY